MNQGMNTGRVISKGSVLEQAMDGPSALDRSKHYGNQASSLMNKTQPNIKGPEKTVAGGAMSALGAGAAGAAMVGALPALGPYAVPIVAGAALLGGAQYFES